MKKLLLVLLLSIFYQMVWAQQSSTIGGLVKDENNNPLVGASIHVQNTNIGSLTDQNGQFELKASIGQTLIISYIGMETKSITIKNLKDLVITMQSEGSTLNELVVIGYGTVKKKDLTGAIASVTADDIQANLAQSTAEALQGKIAGVTVASAGGQPGDGMSINIRGLSSLGSNTPLYVIDGVYGDISMVDPSDIKSIHVLKDASAAAIYGSRAANGVVLITTKSGQRNTAAQITLNAYTGIQKVVKKIDLMNAQQWKHIMKASGYLPQQAQDFKGLGTDWQDQIYRTAPVSKINIDISGGGDHSTYDVSAGYIDQKGILINTGYKAFNIRNKNTFSLFNDNVKIGNTFLVKSGDKKYSDFTITDALRENPLIPVYDKDQLGGYAPFEPWMKNMSNPVGYNMLHNWHTYQTDILINAFAEVNLGIKGLKYKFNLGLNRTTGRHYRYNDAYNFGAGIVKSSIAEDAFFNKEWLVENTLHYNRTFGKHTLSVLLGYSAQENSNRGFGASRKDIPKGTDVISAASPTEQSTSGSLQEHSLISQFGRILYSYDSRYLFTGSLRRDGSSRFAEGQRYGIFPSVALGWNIMNEDFFAPLQNKINVLKLRLSWGKLGNQNIGNYPTQSTVTTGINYLQGKGSSVSWWQGGSTGISWVSPKNLTWEETQTSNIGLDAAFFDNKLTLNADYYIRETKNILLSINMPPSAGLGGAPTLNAGTIENKGFEVLLNYRNSIGEFNYHFGLNASSVRNRVKAVTVGNIQEFGGYNPHNEGTITWAKLGYPIGGFWVIRTDGLFQSEAEVKAHKNSKGETIQPKAKAGDIRFIDANDDGQISADDRQYVGSPFPDLSFGFRAGFTYKALDLSLFFDGMTGNKIYNYTRARIESTNEIINFSTRLLDSWTTTNPNTNIPRFTQKDPNKNWRRSSERWMEDGSFIRLKTLEIGYSLDGDILNKIGLRSGRVYVSGQNLLMITDYTGYTPDLGQNNGEHGGGSGTMTRGTDHGRFPLARMFTVGIQVGF